MSSFNFLLFSVIVLLGQTNAVEYIGKSWYLGCFGIDTTLPEDFFSDTYAEFNSINSPDKCFKFCSERGYVNPVLYNQFYCYCYNSLRFPKERAIENQCQCPCPGNPDKMCGCDNFMRLFELDDVKRNRRQYHGHLHYMGCFQDEEFSRDLNGASKFFPALTQDKCFAYCQREGFKYAGLQDGKFCFCDNNFGRYNKYADERCNCPCAGDQNKNCGCKLKNTVWELRGLAKYEKPVCNHKTTCGCFGDPHCYTFDKSPFDFMGACIYDLVSTTCMKDYRMPRNLVEFDIRQGQEIRTGFPGGSFVGFIEFEALGTKIRFLKSTHNNMFEFTVNGLKTLQPYKDAKRGISIYGTAEDNIILEADFGVTVIWNGKSTRAQVELCSAYDGYVCGLCGNADGEQMNFNEFVGRDNDPVETMDGSVWTRYDRWGNSWKSFDEYQDDESCRREPSVQTRDAFVAPNCVNNTIYKEAFEWCGIMKNLSSIGPWRECLYHLNWLQAAGFVNACSMDMCIAEGNRTKQKELLCDVYSDLDLACKEVLPEWISHWRDITNCPLNCPANKVYDLRRECPRTCSDPDGTDCQEPQWVEGCFCKRGLILDSNGDCVSIDNCGCPMPNTTTKIPVGEVVISQDCSVMYKCLSQKTTPIAFNFKACSKNANCLNMNGNPFCDCKAGYKGDGYVCEPIEKSCHTPYCYGFGDPHYKSVDGKSFDINNTCSYVLATDSLSFVEPTYTIIVDQEDRYNNGRKYMKRIRIVLGADEYSIDKFFWENGAKKPLPYKTDSFEVYEEDRYIVFDDPRFIVHFDGKLMLKLQICESVYYGLCHMQTSSKMKYPYAEFLSEDSICTF